MAEDNIVSGDDGGARPRSDRATLTVVGGGVIGLCCALAAADAGWRVTVLTDPDAPRAADVAGGMLGSLGEGHPGEDVLLEITADSVRRWPALLARLADPAIVVATDSLFVGVTSADVAVLAQLARFVWSGPVGSETVERSVLRQVGGREIRDLEPALGPRPVGGFLASGEGAVDNRMLLRALESALVERGGVVCARRVDSPAGLDGDRILVAAGLGTSKLVSGVDLYAAKGEILRLTANAWSVPGPRHVVRARVGDRMVYLVPRSGGIVIGATQYEPIDAADRAPRVSGVADLLADALEVMPGLQTYDLAEVSVGMRPCTADGLPVVRAVDERVIVATGHGRNGIVLAPWTSHRFVEILGESWAD